MNLFKSKIVFAFLLLFALFALPVSAFAQESSREERVVTLDKSQTINHDYFAAGDQVTLNGTVNGDAYVAGGKVDINGTVNGDLLVAGGQVTIRGDIKQNIRGAGGNVTILGTVGRNVTLVGGNLTIEPNAKVTGNAVLAGGNIDVLSQVKDLTIGGGNVQIANNVLGNVVAGVGKLTIGDGANIAGNLNYWSEDKAAIASGATISGETKFHETKEVAQARRSSAKAIGALAGLGIFFTVVSFLSSVVIGAFILSIFPVYSQRITNQLTSNPGMSILVGLAALIFTPVLVVVLMITLIGFPIALITLFAYFLVLYFSKIFVAMAIGAYAAKIAKFRLTAIWLFVLGLALYYLLGFIPVIGFLVKALTALAGMGAIIIQKKYYLETLRTKKII